MDANDNDTTATGNIYKGIEVYPGLFGNTAATATAEYCQGDSKRICSSYSRHVSYADCEATPAVGETDPK